MAEEDEGPMELKGLAWLLSQPGDFLAGILPKLRGPEFYYYHRRYRRIPTVDECNMNDELCKYEANMQFQRDLRVEHNILDILAKRRDDCVYHWKPDEEFKCAKEIQAYEETLRNWQIKYGDQGINTTALNAFYKQKHRMVYERRHGPVGYGRKPPCEWKKTWEPSMHSTNYVPPGN